MQIFLAGIAGIAYLIFGAGCFWYSGYEGESVYLIDTSINRSDLKILQEGEYMKYQKNMKKQ